MAVSPPSSLAASPHYAAAHLFQPPKSPATTTLTPSFATAGDYFSSAGSSRKRQRPDSSRAHDQYQQNQQHSIRQTPWTQCPTPSDAVYGSASAAYEQDSAFVNERYRLAGGFDTPSLRATHLEPVGIDDEHAFRRRLRDDDNMDNRFMGSECAPSFGPLARERNGAGRMLLSDEDASSRNTTWAGLAFGAIGIVGKVFSFGTTVVRGFYAGGGKGYDLNDQGRFGSGTTDSPYQQAMATPIPGSWQHDDDVMSPYDEDSPSFLPMTEHPPPNKRRQTDRDEWVIVGTPEVETSPKRRISSNNIPRSSLGPPTRPSASRASSRRSLAPVTRRPSSYANVNGSSGSPMQRTPLQSGGGHSRRASIASPRSPQVHSRQSSGGSNGGVGQMSPEAERFARLQARQERKVDRTMTSMEQRMKDMIRQAQQALGTSYSVEGDDNVEMGDAGFSGDEEDWR